MRRHQKNDWSGFTFDAHLFPFADDSMGELVERGLAVTLNLHDASGVNDFEGLFPELVQALGLPASSKKVPMNLINKTVAYAVEDIILGDLIKNKNIAFWWIGAFLPWWFLTVMPAPMLCAAPALLVCTLTPI